MPYDNVLPMDAANRLPGRDDPRLGAILVASGALRAGDMERIVTLHHQKGIRLGEAARQLGLISDRDLQAALIRQHEWLQPEGRPASPELIAAIHPRHPLAERLRELRTQLLLRWLDPAAGRRVLAIVSPGRGEGRSYVAANLAVVFSQLGLRTLLVDADLHRPSQERIFNLPERAGLAAILAGRADGEAVTAVPGFPKLFLLPAGPPPPNPQELLSRPVLDSLLADLAERFDLVLIDTAAAQQASDAKSVAFRARNALLLARKDHTRVADITAMIRELGDTGTRLVGTVINVF